MKIGRRGTILMGNAVAVAGAVVQASAYGLPQMLVGRLLTGFAIGAISCSAPTYLNECANKAQDRGPANAVNAMFLIGSVPLAYWVSHTSPQTRSDWSEWSHSLWENVPDLGHGTIRAQSHSARPYTCGFSTEPSRGALPSLVGNISIQVC